MPNHPPTIIVVHPKERRKKCTVQPLRERDGFVFWKYPRVGTESLDGYVQLGLNGPLIGPDDADRGLLVLDGTWRFAAQMEQTFEQTPVRSLPDWTTAYPRVSKLFSDPECGLATIEAIFAAYVMMGREADGLLDDYHWGPEFLRLNDQLIRNYAPRLK
jgi:pre-rRNA-processing protein TSR3